MHFKRSPSRPSKLGRTLALGALLSVLAIGLIACGNPASGAPPVIDDDDGGGGLPVMDRVDVSPFQKSVFLETQETIQLTATRYPADLDFIWVSEDPAVASVDATGKVTPHSVGSCQINAMAADGNGWLYGFTQITVWTVDSFLDAYAAEVRPRSANMMEDGAIYIQSDLILGTGSDGVKIAWASSNPAVISTSGTVTQPTYGTDMPVTLTATVSMDPAFIASTKSRTKIFSLMVQPVNYDVSDGVVAVENIDLAPAAHSFVLEEGQSAQLSATISPAEATYKQVRWVSSDYQVADVSETGVVTPLTAGSATISALAVSGNAVGDAAITVTSNLLDAFNAIQSLQPGFAEGDHADSVTADLTLPESVAGCTVTWSSSNTDIITADGRVTQPRGYDKEVALSATLTKGSGAAARSAEKTIWITVRNCGPILPTAIELSSYSELIVIETGKKLSILPSFQPYDTGDKSVTWTSSNAAVATVDSEGSVSAVGPGSVLITATSIAAPTVSASCAIQVRSNQQDADADINDIAIGYSTGDSASSVTQSVVLPSKGPRGSAITWTTNAPGVLSQYGQVTRPTSADAVVVLKAKASQGTGTVDDPLKLSAERSFTLTVKQLISAPPVVAIASASLNEETIRFDLDDGAGQTRQLTASLSPAGANEAVFWFSDDESIASVSTSGKVSAGTKRGETTVRLKKSGSGSWVELDSCKVVVGSDSGDLLDDYYWLQPTYAAGDSASSVTQSIGLPATAPKGATIAWSEPGWFDDDGTLLFRPNGSDVSIVLRATLKSPFDATLTRIKDFSLRLPYDTGLVTGVALSSSAMTINWNESSAIIATVSPAEARDKTVLWSSSDPSAVSVDQNGVVKGLLAEKTATITAKTQDGNYAKTCVVTVRTTKYDVATDAAEALTRMAYATGDVRTKVLGDLSLPSVGRLGSSLSWQSSNASIVSPTGTVTRPADDKVHVVTIRPSASKGGLSAQGSSIDLIVWGASYTLPGQIPEYSISCRITGGAFLADGTSYVPPTVTAATGTDLTLAIAYCALSDGDYDKLRWYVNGVEQTNWFNYKTMRYIPSVPGVHEVKLVVMNRQTGADKEFVTVKVNAE